MAHQTTSHERDFYPRMAAWKWLALAFFLSLAASGITVEGRPA